MTEAGWTREKPTVAGWYWWRRDQHALPGVAIVCSDLSGYYMNRTGHNSTFDHVDDVIGEWLGPITPDSFQQGRVAGLREAEDYAEQCVKERQLQLLNLGDQAALDPNDRRPGWIRCKASEARRIQVWCARQTQQAQEGGVGDGKTR